MHPFLSRYLPAVTLNELNKLNMARQVGTTTPAPRPAGEALNQLGEAMDRRIAKVAPDAPRYYDEGTLQLEQNTPTHITDVFKDGLAYGGNYRGRNAEGDIAGYKIRINPLADRSFLAHELGHTVTDSTNIGRTIRTLREKTDPSTLLGKALGVSSLAVPFGIAAAIPGDEDVGAVTALAAATAAPTLIDEVLASKNALAIMKGADMSATLGQRGRLAGAFATYLGTASIPGLVGGLTGNIFDKDLTTPGELSPQ